jgi:hypothetical protein
VCRGELPESPETRLCSEFLTIETLASFASAKKRTLDFRVGTLTDTATHSWVEWKDADKTDAVLHIRLLPTPVSDGHQFDALSADE